MKELALYNLKEGMVLAKDITTPSGQVVLEKGKELTKQSILRLSFYNIKSACIVDGEEKQAAPKSYSQKSRLRRSFSLSRWITRSCSVRSVSALRAT